MAFTWAREEDVVSVSYYKSMAIVDGLLWKLDGANVFHSPDGSTWTNDAAWTTQAGTGISAYNMGQIFEHENLLYLIGNDGDNAGGSLWKREDDAWTLVHAEADSEHRYARAHSNGTWILIGGTQNTAGGPPYGAMLWVWTGAGMVLEFEANRADANRDVYGRQPYYWGTEWYWATRWRPGGLPYVDRIRYRNGGAWTFMYAPTRQDGDDNCLRFATTTSGMLVGGHLWNGAAWSDTGFLGSSGPSIVPSTYTAIMGRVDAGNEGLVYTWDGAIWTAQGNVDTLTNCLYLCDFSIFQGELYAAGARNWV